MTQTTHPCIVGSSPLARGLHVAQRLRRDARRIIPARAGFTVVTSGKGTDLTGSSPLARGLLDWALWNDFYDRIIPARAGFTRSLLRPSPQ